MTAEILVVVPVLNRPLNARPLVESLVAATEATWRLVFVCTPGDTAQIEACNDLAAFDGVDVVVVPWPAGPADYAKKTNYAFGSSDEPYLLLGADDLRFHPCWDQAALDVAHEFDVGVVGTNDLGNGAVLAGRHSTHPLVARAYIDAHGGTFDATTGVVFSEAYAHQMVDSELVAVATARGCYAHCHGAVVEHLHPLWRKAEMGATYRKALSDGAADRRLFEERQSAWTHRTVAA